MEREGRVHEKRREEQPEERGGYSGKVQTFKDIKAGLQTRRRGSLCF